MCDENVESDELLAFEKPYHGDLGNFQFPQEQNPNRVSLARLCLTNEDEGTRCVECDSGADEAAQSTEALPWRRRSARLKA